MLVLSTVHIVFFLSKELYRFDQVKIQDKNLLFFEEGNQKPFLNSHQKFD